MGLSPDLISEFVKVTNDTKKSNTNNSVFGTVCEYDGSYYVKFDGSDLLTPISTTTDIHDGERVMVTIKNHTAIITGNMSSPAVNLETTIDNGEEGTVKLSDLGISIHDGVVKINELEAKALTAESAVIKELKANDVTISGKLDANEADIKTLKANDVTISGKLEANEADISKLKTDKLDASTADIKYATIENLKATNTDVDNLNADVADINTLIFGSAAGDTIHTSFANAVIAQLGVAQIKSAMIDSVSADKITAGDIVTNNVRVVSEDGKLLISDETIQISDETRVRVQIGKDASGDYSINIWDVDGNLMFSEGGITDSAIKEAIIRNDMVSENANISASKLNIDSLFTEINNSSKTIKSSKIYLNDEEQTLDVAFTSITTDVDGIKSDVKTQGTQLSVVQGKIDSKVWQQDIDTAKGEMDTRYSSLEQSLDGFKTTVSETYSTKDDLANLTIGGRNLLYNNRLVPIHSNNPSLYPITCEEMIENNISFYRIKRTDSTLYPNTMSLFNSVLKTTFNYNEMVGQQVTLSFKARASRDVLVTFMNYAYYGSTQIPFNKQPETVTTEWKTFSVTIDDFPVIEDGGGVRWSPYMISLVDGEFDTFYLDVRDWKFEKGNKATDWSPAPEDIENELTNQIATVKTDIVQTKESITSLATKTQVIEDKFGNYSTTQEMNSAIEQKAGSITLQVSTNYATKTELSKTDAKAEAAQEDVDNLEIGGRNLIRDSDAIVTKQASDVQPEFIQYTDLSPIFDEHGLGEYTLSFDIKSADITNKNSVNVYCLNGSDTKYDIGYNNVPVTTEYVRHSFTITPTLNDETVVKSMLAFYGTYDTGNIPCVKNVKLEKGNKATDWTPAPEDATDDIDAVAGDAKSALSRLEAAEAAIKLLQDSITMLVRKGDQASQMVFDEESSTWSFNTSEIDDNITQHTTDIEGLQGKTDATNTNVDALQDKVDEWEEHISITTYEDEPCLKLFEEDSNYIQYVTNTRRIVTETVDGEETVKSEINIDSASYNKVTAKEASQIGNFVWKQRGTNRLCLMWEGVTE